MVQVHEQCNGHAVPPYPLFLNIDAAKVVVIGAGSVALRKVRALLQHGASITVIAPDAHPELSSLAEAGVIAYERRPYSRGDLKHAMMAVAATSDSVVNQAVHDEAVSYPILVNVVDEPGLCNCFFPAVMSRGLLQIAVSTAGAAPGVARDLSKDLDERFDEWWGPYVSSLAEARALVKRAVDGADAKRRLALEALGSADVRDRFERGERPTGLELYQQVVVPMLAGGES